MKRLRNRFEVSSDWDGCDRETHLTAWMSVSSMWKGNVIITKWSSAVSRLSSTDALGSPPFASFCGSGQATSHRFQHGKEALLLPAPIPLTAIIDPGVNTKAKAGQSEPFGGIVQFDPAGEKKRERSCLCVISQEIRFHFPSHTEKD